MHWIMWLWAADVALRFIILGRPRISDDAGGRGGVAMFLFPGILAETVNQFTPIRKSLEAYGRLFYANFDMTRAIYSPWHNKRVFAKSINKLDAKHQFDQVVLVGCSMGATVALDVNDEMHLRNPSMQKPGLVVFDGIGGTNNLVFPMNVAAPVAAYLRFVPVGFFCGLFLSSILMVGAYFINPLPADDEIEFGLDKKAVKKKARRDMGGYQLSVQVRQLVHMRASKVTPERLSRFAWIVYFEHTDHNVTLRQPAEMNKWAAMAYSANVPFASWDIESPHVAFAQMPRIANKRIVEALGLPPSSLAPSTFQ